MKKNLVRLIVVLTMMSFFMFGCGKSEADTTTKEDKKEVEETTVAEPAVEEVQEPQKEEAVEEVSKQEEEQETSAEETGTEEVEEETLANEIIMNSDSIEEWISTVEGEELKFIIYNDTEGYKQILNDGETYHMKNGDKIFLYYPEGVVENCRVLTLDVKSGPGEEIYTPNGYSIEIFWEDKDVVTYGEELTMEGIAEPLSITCTFYKATE